MFVCVHVYGHLLKRKLIKVGACRRSKLSTHLCPKDSEYDAIYHHWMVIRLMGSKGMRGTATGESSNFLAMLCLLTNFLFLMIFGIIYGLEQRKPLRILLESAL